MVAAHDRYEEIRRRYGLNHAKTGEAMIALVQTVSAYREALTIEHEMRQAERPPERG